VELVGGERLFAGRVVANTDPKRTLLTLLEPGLLAPEFARDLQAFRQESASLRMNLALSGLPEFAALPGAALGPQHRATVVMIDSAEHLDQAFHSARMGVPASPPIMEAVIPSAVDDSLVDRPGHHVMSLLCKYMPYDLANGESWDAAKPRVVADILSHLARYIPNLPDVLVAHSTHTPLDLERVLGMTRGDICHGRMEPDQLWALRPHPAAAQYRTPIPGLYLCGSGTHPGGGVTGAPGYNAAHCVLRDG
jgi:phytoene dehydrogenase-like protein